MKKQTQLNRFADRIFNGPQKIGIAFGSGGARGWAHIGVMQVLQEWGLSPHCVCGTSIGSIAAAALSLGKLNEFEEFAKSLNTMRSISSFFEISRQRGGLLAGDKAMETIGEILGNPNIEEMPIPYAAAATDINTGETIVFTKGPLLQAIRASISIPFVFTPVYRPDGRVLIDGAYSDPIPVDIAREKLKAQRVIAVNIENAKPCPYKTESDLKLSLSEIKANVRRWLGLNDEEEEHFRAPLEKPADDRLRAHEVSDLAHKIHTRNFCKALMENLKPDLLIEPAVGGIGTLQFERAEDAIRAGYDAASEGLRSWLHENW